jgi:curved DNA-binding protein CbpA
VPGIAGAGTQGSATEAMDYDRDYYETLQISSNADPDTIHRVYRLLAQRFHPDNQDTGDEKRFREANDAYAVLSDPSKRAEYDVHYQQNRKSRIRLVSVGDKVESDFQMEQLVRLAVLKALYTQRRVDGNNPGIFDLDLEQLTGTSREHLEFTFWYLMQKRLIMRGDHSRLTITAEGVDYLEQNYEANLQRKRLKEKNSAA